MWEWADGENADMVLELNVIDEQREVEQDTRCRKLLLGRQISLERVRTWRQQMVLCERCVLRLVWHDMVSKRPYKIMKGHLNIIRYFKGYDIMFYS